MEALYSVVERDAGGDVTARFDYLPEYEAKTMAAALRRNRKRINTDLYVEIEECRQPDRYTGWTDLTALASYGYVPESVVFTDTDDQRLLEIRASDLDAFDAWAKRLGVTVSARDVSRPATRHSAAEGLWRGWWVTLECVVADFGTAEPAHLTAAAVLTPDSPDLPDSPADYGFNSTQPPAEPCLTVVGTGPECDNCGGPSSGVHSNHTRTEDAAYRAADEDADLSPYVTVEVREQSPWGTRVMVPVPDGGRPLNYGVTARFAGNPAWLSEVPIGKGVLVRAAYVRAANEWEAALTDWVEPADDHCSPRLDHEYGWVIGDDTCAEVHRGYADPAAAVVRHNLWLASVLNRPTADLGPVPAPSAPVAVSPERVAEIRRELNLCGHDVDREANVAGGTVEIGSFDQNALVVTLVDGQRIVYRSGAWQVQP